MTGSELQAQISPIEGIYKTRPSRYLPIPEASLALPNSLQATKILAQPRNSPFSTAAFYLPAKLGVAELEQRFNWTIGNYRQK